jgi:hypothetical protein
MTLLIIARYKFSLLLFRVFYVRRYPVHIKTRVDYTMVYLSQTKIILKKNFNFDGIIPKHLSS